ncbi:MAG: hypothetical protein WC154_08745, partial [Candidatus Izemoplasmatales bacterium]
MKIYVTDKYDKNKLSQLSNKSSNKSKTMIFINNKIKYQKIIGFGGAFTEAACYTLSKLSKENQSKLLNAYFNKETGLNYNLGRIHMNSSDFSLENYTYVEDYDSDLSTFDISRELKYVIPTIKKAEKIRQNNIDILVSPWSPPAWMKTNNNMNYGGKLKSEYAET